MKTVIDAKALREKIEKLYKGIDLTQDDEQLLKNERLSLQHQDPVFREEWEIKNQEAIDLKVQDPVWRANLVARNQAMANDPIRNQKISESITELYRDPEFKEKKTTAIKKAFKKPQVKKNHEKGIDKREENGWVEKNLKAREKTLKPIHAGEYGDFPSKKAAVEGMTKAKVVNAGGKLSVWLKTKPDEYYYIKDTK